MRRFYFKLTTDTGLEVEERVMAPSGKDAKQAVLSKYPGCRISMGPIELPR